MADKVYYSIVWRPKSQECVILNENWDKFKEIIKNTLTDLGLNLQKLEPFTKYSVIDDKGKVKELREHTIVGVELELHMIGHPIRIVELVITSMKMYLPNRIISKLKDNVCELFPNLDRNESFWFRNVTVKRYIRVKQKDLYFNKPNTHEPEYTKWIKRRHQIRKEVLS